MRQHLDDLAFTINYFYPLFWVALSLVVYFCLHGNHELISQLTNLNAWISEMTMPRLRVNEEHPFSTPIAKALTAVSLTLIPLQLLFLSFAGRDNLEDIIFKQGKAALAAAAAFCLACFVIIFFVLPPSSTGMVRSLGGGDLAVAIFIPLFTSALPLGIRLCAYLLLNRNSA